MGQYSFLPSRLYSVNLQKLVFKQAVGGKKKKLEVLAILNQYKDMHDDFINSLNDSSDSEPSAMSNQVNMLSNNMPGLENSISSLQNKRNFLRNRSLKHK